MTLYWRHFCGVSSRHSKRKHVRPPGVEAARWVVVEDTGPRHSARVEWLEWWKGWLYGAAPSPSGVPGGASPALGDPSPGSPPHPTTPNTKPLGEVVFGLHTPLGEAVVVVGTLLSHPQASSLWVR